MSIKLLSAAWDLDIGSTEKMVLMCLCDFASDDGGNCWPSVATICRKTSKSERTVQGAIRWLADNGFLTMRDVPGKCRQFKLDSRKICAPAVIAPPQKTSKTPAKSAPKPLRTTITRERVAHELPDDWEPEFFGSGTKSRMIEDGWPPGERETQIEHFRAHHRKKGDKFKDWQAAWSTWVLNNRKFGNGRRNAQHRGTSQARDGRSSLARAIDEGLDWLG